MFSDFYYKRILSFLLTSLGISEISSSEWLSLNQFVQELKTINSQCISVYYPYGKGHDTIQLLKETSRSERLKKIENKIENKFIPLKVAFR